MSEILLFGAGASKDAGLPDTFELTDRVLSLFEQTPSVIAAKVINYVAAGLLFGKGISNCNPVGHRRVDVEALYRAIDWLGHRRTFETSPFVTGWHSRVEELENSIEPTTNAYAETNRQIILKLRHILWPADPDVAYLQPLFGLVKRQGRIVIATLNYDNVVEKFCSNEHIELTTGIQDDNGGYDARIGYRLVFGDAGVNLLKLHGSLNWVMFDPQTAPSGFCPHPFVLRWPEPPLAENMLGKPVPALLFGGENKLSAAGPFLQLLMRFRDELEQASILTIVGYSFRDDHVNLQIADFLNRDPLNRVRIVDPKLPRGNLFFDSLLESCSSRVELIPLRAAEAFSGLFARD